jgi:hypothetical protein
MWLATILPVLAALMAGLLVWRRETRRLDGRSFNEARGWDTSEKEFRRQVTGRRKWRRFGVSVLSALAASVLTTAVLQLVQLSGMARGG